MLYEAGKWVEIVDFIGHYDAPHPVEKSVESVNNFLYTTSIMVLWKPYSKDPCAKNPTFYEKMSKEETASMLLIVDNLHQLRFSALMDIYIEGNLEKAEDGLSLLEAEQDFYQYLHDVFFPTPGARYCIWTENGTYVSALRLEPYRDGWLLEALETAPQHRRHGYARQLVQSVTALPEYPKIYSHVHRENVPSLRLHEACGFQKILDHAVYIDGSVNRHSVTLFHEYRKPE